MEAQENSQTEQNVQTPKKRELALVSRSTYIKEKALQWIFFACAFLAVVTVILMTGSMNLSEIVGRQGGWIWHWNLFQWHHNPLVV